MSGGSWGPVLWVAAGAGVWIFFAVAVRVRTSIVTLRVDAPSQEVLGYELVSLLRRLESDRRALAIRLRFFRWAAFLLAPTAVGIALSPLGTAPAVLGGALGWLGLSLVDAGRGPLTALGSGPAWMFRAWVRVSEPLVRLGRLLQRMRQREPEADRAMRRILAESQVSLTPLGGALGAEERRLLRKLLASTAIVVQDIMTKWPKVKVVPGDAGHDQLLGAFKDSGHSRLPVTRGDRILGVIHVKEALTSDPETPLAELMRSPYFVRRESVVQEVFDALRKAREHLAVVVDELGRPVGVVTVEDILEELVGELYDEREAPREAGP